MNKKGFSLLEVLLVVAIIAILAGIVILAINPTKQLGDSRNANRRADVNTILNAVYQYALDNRGSLPPAVSTTPLYICQTATTTCSGYASLSELTTNEKYLVSVPIDPSYASGSTSTTGYRIYKTANNRVTVEAPGAEQSQSISVTR
jgi:type IV pilus assembly protein PilA